ncbi:MAG: glycosyltransferase family 39 protein [Anaerolineae bacterium]|nr:glycosyltransferase family 39 protein [Anaerolineae bacterium]
MRPRWDIYAASAGLLILFALLTLGARQTSLTADEPTYIAWGYALLAQGREAFPLLIQRGYPPLLIEIEAALLYAANPTIPVDHLAGWPDDYATFLAAFKPYMEPLDRTKMAARMPLVLLTVLMGAVVFRWARDLWGVRAGLIALGMMIFDPLLLAHGRLAHSDAGVAALGTAALYAVWRWTRKPSWHGAFGAGVLLGLTMLAKLSGPLWVVTAGVMIAGAIMLEGREKAIHTYLVQGGLALIVALVVLWAGYGFEVGRLPGFPLSVFAPTHWQNLRFLDQYTDVYFALGEWSTSGWWWYFPLAFAIKNPLPLLIGLVFGLIALLRRPISLSRLLSLGVFPLLYTAVAVWQRMNLGYRHILPVHPFLYLIIGGGIAQFVQAPKSLWRWGFFALGLWYILGTLRIFPYEISFFNELVGGVEGGYRYLSDSNVGWGQTDALLNAYTRAHPEVQVQPPDARFLPPAGRYLVSASYLQGIGLSDRDAYAWFRQQTPQNLIAFSLLLYDVPAFDPRWFAQCSQPVAPLDEAEIAQGTGRNDLRVVEFDCTRAWLYPDGGISAGIYAFDRQVIGLRQRCWPSLLSCPAEPQDTFLARRLIEARLSFESSIDDLLLYGRASHDLIGLFAGHAVYAATTPAQAGSSTMLAGPVELDGPLTFLGAVAYAGDRLEVETWWQATDGPVSRPFSVMAHWLAPDGQTRGVADGLGVSPIALSVGDLLVQRHRFDAAGVGDEVWLLTGAYWLDSMVRWPLSDISGGDSLLVRLPVVTLAKVD